MVWDFRKHIPIGFMSCYNGTNKVLYLFSVILEVIQKNFLDAIVSIYKTSVRQAEWGLLIISLFFLPFQESPLKGGKGGDHL